MKEPIPEAERAAVALFECTAAITQLVKEESVPKRVKWTLLTAVRVSEVILSEGRVPSTEEALEWVVKQFVVRLQLGTPKNSQ